MPRPLNRIEARARSAIGALGRRLSSPSVSGVGVPSVAMNARSQAAIAWSEADEEGVTRIFGAAFAP
jgi:hypothetical protein